MRRLYTAAFSPWTGRAVRSQTRQAIEAHRLPHELHRRLALALGPAVLGFNALGGALRDLRDPRLRAR